LTREHAPRLFPVLSDPDLHRFTGGDPPASPESLAERYSRLESRRSGDGSELWLNWVLLRNEDAAAIGYVQASVGAAVADIAWVIGTKWQEQGYASEAAGALVSWLRAHHAPPIRACVHPGHAASRRVAERAGLRLTAEIVDGEEVWAEAIGEHPEDREGNRS
jgi:RimJ/RimL family protein N-acetyltransferase